jgi:sec-independent protein translocase protein TatB
MGRVKRMASEFQGQFQEALREAEVSDLKQQADDLTGELKSLADVDPMAGSDTVKDDTGDHDWDEPPFETPSHETPEHAEAGAESAPDAEKSAADQAADIEPAPVAAVEQAPVEADDSAPPAEETPPPKQAGGTA